MTWRVCAAGTAYVIVPETGVPAGAVPKMVTLLPAADCSSAPVTAPFITTSGVAVATCAADGARSKTVSHSRFALAASVGRVSARHTLLHVLESDARWSVTATAAFA